jgi:endonuclease YncB( thermonuclease family)
MKQSGRLPFTQTDLSVELARNGLASLYTGSGAEYDDSFDILQQAIADAQRNKRGIWSSGIKQMVNPSDYKRAIRNRR